MRDYGEVWLEKDRWHIKAEPQILLRLKRYLDKIDKGEFGTVLLSDNDQNRLEIDAFLYRFRLKISPKDKALLTDGAKRVEDKILTLEQIMGPKYKPKAYKMALQPRTYQAQVAEIVVKNGFLLLGDDVGLGKTCAAITCFTHRQVLPAIVVTLSGTLPDQWAAEVRRFIPDLYPHVIQSRGLYKFPTENGRTPDVIVTTYHKIKPWAEVLAEYGKMVVFDEAQELRHADSAKYEAAKYISRSCVYSLALSATPIFGYGGEIYNVLDALKEDCLGNRDEFIREWCSEDGGKRKVSIRDPKAFGAYLREQFLMIRRTREEVKRELPPLSKIPYHVPADASALDKVKDSAAALAKIILSQDKIAGFDKLQAKEQLSHMLRQATGIAKCLAVGTRVIKADGSIEVVEHLKKGDRLLGPDGKPRCILDTIEGHGELYEISSTSKQPLFEPYVVNGDHILALKHSGKIRHGDRFLFGKYLHGDHIEVSVSDYLTKSRHFRRLLKGYKTGVEFKERQVPIDPYFLGLWLGDGSSHTAAITTSDQEIVQYLSCVAAEHGIRVRIKNPERTAPTYCFTPNQRGGNMRKAGNRNPILTLLRTIGVLHNKHIPDAFLITSRSQRMRLLAGLIDSDGHFYNSGVYEISTKWAHLARQICRLVWSLGLAGKVRKIKVRNQTAKEFSEYRISIYGNGLEDLPVLVPRKKSPPRYQVKDPLRSGISIKPIGPGPYHGFVLDCDGLFLLEDYTVTHNSSYVADFVRLIVENGEKALVFCWHREVYEILMAKLEDLNPVMFTGSETPKEKLASKERFTNGDSKVMLMSLRAGQGVDGLQHTCKTVIFAELDWAPGVMEQNTGRVFRDGQKDPVSAFFLVTDSGSDPIVAEALGLKTAQLEGIRNPNQDLIEKLQQSSDWVEKLAKDYLTRHKKGRNEVSDEVDLEEAS